MLPAFCGISSENAAHRIAVEWDTDSGTESGVYIPRRDTSSLLNAFAGGRIFPGVHNRARFDVRETKDEFHIAMQSVDDSASVKVVGRTTNSLPEDSVFATLEECSQFFAEGSLGYSPAQTNGDFDGLELRTDNWRVDPLAVTEVHSSFFEDRETFPPGSVTFDNALLMQGIDHQWHSRQPICCNGR